MAATSSAGGGGGGALAVLKGHSGAVYCVALGEVRGRTVLASGSFDKTVIVWDAATHKPLTTLTGHTGLVLSVAIGRSGSRAVVVSASVDGTLRVHDAETYELLKVLTGHSSSVRSVTMGMAGDAEVLVSGSWDKTLRVWDGVTFALVTVLKGHSRPVYGVATGRAAGTGLIVSASEDKTLRVWRAAASSFDLVKVLTGHTDYVRDVTIGESGDAAVIVSASADRTLRIWHAVSFAVLGVLRGHTSYVRSVAMRTVGGRALVVSAGDRTVRFWDAASCEQLAVEEGHSDEVMGVAFGAVGGAAVVASGSDDKTVRLWDPPLSFEERLRQLLGAAPISVDPSRLRAAISAATAAKAEASLVAKAEAHLASVERALAAEAAAEEEAAAEKHLSQLLGAAPISVDPSRLRAAISAATAAKAEASLVAKAEAHLAECFPRITVTGHSAVSSHNGHTEYRIVTVLAEGGAKHESQHRVTEFRKLHDSIRQQLGLAAKFPVVKKLVHFARDKDERVGTLQTYLRGVAVATKRRGGMPQTVCDFLRVPISQRQAEEARKAEEARAARAQAAREEKRAREEAAVAALGWSVGGGCASLVALPPTVNEGDLGRVVGPGKAAGTVRVEFGDGKGSVDMDPRSQIDVPGHERVAMLEQQLTEARAKAAAAVAAAAAAASGRSVAGRCASVEEAEARAAPLRAQAARLEEEKKAAAAREEYEQAAVLRAQAEAARAAQQEADAAVAEARRGVAEAEAREATRAATAETVATLERELRAKRQMVERIQQRRRDEARAAAEREGNALHVAMFDAAAKHGSLFSTLRSASADGGGEARFEARPLVFGRPKDAALGVEHYLCVKRAYGDNYLRTKMIEGVAAIRAEVAANGTATDKECLAYVLEEEAGSSDEAFQGGLKRDCDAAGNVMPERRGMFFPDFVAHESARTAGLEEAHVAALRFYTTAAFRTINNGLRDAKRFADGEPHPFPVTVAFMKEAIGMLRAVAADAEEASESGAAVADVPLFRGMKGMEVDGDFLRKGGTELAPMSTTSDLGIAMHYSASESSLLLRVASSSFMNKAPEISFLSAFPAEKEYLFPPLCYLKPTGSVQTLRVDDANYTVVDVEASI